MDKISYKKDKSDGSFDKKDRKSYKKEKLDGSYDKVGQKSDKIRTYVYSLK